jgi:hypothetical protein
MRGQGAHEFRAQGGIEESGSCGLPVFHSRSAVSWWVVDAANAEAVFQQRHSERQIGRRRRLTHSPSRQTQQMLRHARCRKRI